MSLELLTLRMLKYRDRYEKLARAIPKRALEVRTQIILDDMGRYFREFPESQKVEPGPFALLFKMIHPTLKEEQLAVYDQLFAMMQEDAEPSLEPGLMKRLAVAATAFDTAELLTRVNAGEEVDLRTGMQNLLQAYDNTVIKTAVDPQVRDPIEDLLKAEENDEGLHWRLPGLDAALKPITSGDFIVVAARPDKGKTTFSTDQLTYMASQVDRLWPGQDRSILWLNNEGPGRKIVSRAFQSALNATTEEMIAMSNAGVIRQKYIEALGGRGGALRIFDIHSWRNDQVEDLIAKYKPALVVFDMIDNIRFGGEVANGGQRTDQLLEAMYQWARELGVRYDCGVIAMSQISGDGDGLQYPTLSMLKDSKTGKQGAADVIITIGASNDPMLEWHRYIGVTKNKRGRTGIPNPRLVTILDKDRGRYVEQT